MRKIQMERYVEYPLDAGERPKRLYEYWLTGRGVFPFDMLRYDGAWPAGSEDAAKMEWSFASPRGENLRSIKLRSYREPTTARWSSFIWSVSPEEFRIERPFVPSAQNM